MSEHRHRFGQTWWADAGWITHRWCVDCDQWVALDEPDPIAAASDYPRERKATRKATPARVVDSG